MAERPWDRLGAPVLPELAAISSPPPNYNMDGSVNLIDQALFNQDLANNNPKADYDGDCALTSADADMYTAAKNTPHAYCGPILED